MKFTISQLAKVGLLATAAFLYDNFKSLFSILKAKLELYFRPQLPQSLTDKFGKWAVITGGSDGIGKGYAKELARRGINVVIISHMKEELIATAKEIENLYGTEAKWIVADFSKGKEVYQHIKHELRDIPVGILVNNVGCASYPDELGNRSEDFLWSIINVNVGAVTVMSRLIIPQMKKHGKGAIVNIASGFELMPTPLMAVYGATKRYVRSLSLAMERELSEYNITVQCVTPVLVVTKIVQFSDFLSQSYFFGTSVEAYTRSLVLTLGKTQETTGYWTHAIIYFIGKLTPEWLRIRIIHAIARYIKKGYMKNRIEKKSYRQINIQSYSVFFALIIDIQYLYIKRIIKYP
uniref:Uncharacterized protein n=1 Tax=Glossina brevipalpis TaxID=37001 RepID=A0A1A9WL14_9MUSC